MALPSLPFLRKSRALWKTRHTHRQARLELWRRRESSRYRKWRGYVASKPGGHRLRSKWFKLYSEADIAVDKWAALRDEASLMLRKRRREIGEHGEQASEHFAVSEFDCRDGTPVPRAAYGALGRLCDDVLEPMRDRFGACTVNSGYRHRAYNASIGGASQSQHIYDESPDSVAADVTFERGTPAEWAAYARSLGEGGVGQYRSFVHVDNGPRRDWWG